MKNPRESELEPYLEHLRALAFVESVELELAPRGSGEVEADARVVLRTPQGEKSLLVEWKRSHVSRSTIDVLWTDWNRAPREGWILFAPHVGQAIGSDLRDRGINYMDAAGNCSLNLAGSYIALVEGKRAPKKDPLSRGLRGPGHKVLFALLAKPELLDATVREVGEAAGVGKTTAAQTLNRLESEKTIGSDQKGRHLLKPNALLERWVAGYIALVRPRLLIGRYRTADESLEALEERIASTLGAEATWAWGGGAGAMRLTGHYHGPESILHLERADPDLRKRLNAVPAKDGPLIILGVPGPVAFDGVKQQTAHPLLVYTELLVSGDERAREAADMIRERYLVKGQP